MPTQVQIPKSKALIKKQNDLSKMFAGSADLLKSDKPNERTLILLVAKSYSLPAMCVNVMGGLPYINKDGLLYKLNEYEGSNIVSLTSKAIQYAKVPGERAIFESTLVLKDRQGRERTFNATGEADNASIKLEMVKATPNMMAETRSQNRVIGRAIKAKILKDLYTALGRAKGFNDDDRIIIEGAAMVSAEEMTGSPRKEVPTMSRSAKMQVSLDKIKAEKDPNQLTHIYEMVKKASIYTEAEKKELISAIATQRKKYAGN